MATVLLVIHIMVAFSMIVLILLQRSEGGALGMGGGGGGFVTGRGAANLLTRTTAILAAIFFTTSLALGIFSHRPAPTSAVGLPVPAQTAPGSAPAGEQAPQSLPPLNLQKLKPQTPPAQAPAPVEPAKPRLPQSQ
jgi:preprotein translocase subunit SecG